MLGFFILVQYWITIVASPKEKLKNSIFVIQAIFTVISYTFTIIFCFISIIFPFNGSFSTFQVNMNGGINFFLYLFYLILPQIFFIFNFIGIFLFGIIINYNITINVSNAIYKKHFFRVTFPICRFRLTKFITIEFLLYCIYHIVFSVYLFLTFQFVFLYNDIVFEFLFINCQALYEFFLFILLLGLVLYLIDLKPYFYMIKSEKIDEENKKKSEKITKILLSETEEANLDYKENEQLLKQFESYENKKKEEESDIYEKMKENKDGITNSQL